MSIVMLQSTALFTASTIKASFISHRTFGLEFCNPGAA
jgi:hypothetical protein